MTLVHVVNYGDIDVHILENLATLVGEVSYYTYVNVLCNLSTTMCQLRCIG